MSNTIELSQVEDITGVTATKWERNGRTRHYINIPGSASKIYWAAGKVHFDMGRGRSSSEANAIITNLLGCHISDRRRQAAPYVIVEG